VKYKQMVYIRDW